jgi:uncharacterized protein (TIGR00288 family)
VRAERTSAAAPVRPPLPAPSPPPPAELEAIVLEPSPKPVPVAPPAKAAPVSGPKQEEKPWYLVDPNAPRLDQAPAPRKAPPPPALEAVELDELAPFDPVIVAPYEQAVAPLDAGSGADEPAVAEMPPAADEPRSGRSRRGRGRRGGRGDERAEAPPVVTAASPEPAAVVEEPRPRRPERAGRPDPRAERRSAAPNGATHSITTDEISTMREMVFSVPTFAAPPARVTEERKIAMFCDLENVALGVRDSEIKKFDITLILERLLEKGKIIVKKAYADWERYSDYKRPFHEAGIELLDIPQKYYSGKNSADIKMVVDAMDVCYAKDHLDTFVIVSGDSDFTPLVSKLKENDKHVIGIGVRNSTSNLLIDNCDEFIFYEDIWRDQQAGPDLAGLSKKSAEVFGLMIDAIQALLRENKDVLWGSMIKQTMQRKKPSFNEGYFGYTSFSELLEDAERKGILKLKKDQRSGTYVVTGFAER